MKKMYLLLLLMVSCINHTNHSDEQRDSSIVLDNGFGVVIYDTTLKKDTTIQIFKELEDGSVLINENGDSLYWLGGDVAGTGNYISKKEWDEYITKKNKLLKD